MSHLSSLPLLTPTKLNMYFTLITNCSLTRSSLLHLPFAFVMELANILLQTPQRLPIERVTQLNSALLETKVLDGAVKLFRIGSVIYVT